MFARTFEAGGQAQDFRFTEARTCRNARERGFAFGQRPGFIDNQRIDFFHDLQRFCVLDQNSGSCAAADAHHNRHRCRQTQSARTRDDQDSDSIQDGMRKAGLRTNEKPDEERNNGHSDHRRHEIGRYNIRQTLDGCSASLSLADHGDDLSQERLAADAFGTHKKCAVTVDGPADNAVARRLLDRYRLAGNHRFINRALAFHDGSVDRNLLPRTDSKHVADMHLVQGNVALGPVFCHNSRCFGSQTKKSLDGQTGSAAGPEFEDLAEQDECGDHGRSLEIDGNTAEEKRRDEAVEIRRPDTDCDQRKHVGTAVDHRCPAAFEQGPAGPEDDRRREGQLDNRVDFEHPQNENRQAQSGANPESPGHVRELGILLFLGRDHFGFERHAAFRTRTGTGLANLRVHGTGVETLNDLGWRIQASGFRGTHEAIRVCAEAFDAPKTTEVIRAALVFVFADSGFRQDLHQAHRIRFKLRRS